MLAVFILVPACLWAAGPAWWTERGVLNPAATADDYAAVNQGQVKNIAKQAYEEIKAKLGSAGSTLDAIWANPATSTDDYAAINVGQLKNVAKPFYDRLAEIGYTGQPLTAGSSYPWSNATTAADDYALANIGQVKNLFSFSISVLVNTDSDGNGLSDAWEMQYFGHLGVDPNANPSGDGMSNLYKYAMGLSPLIESGGDKDGDDIPNNEDARPGDPSIGRLIISITVPANGGTIE